MEDIALAHAIKEGEATESVDKQETWIGVRALLCLKATQEVYA
jgi:hypothetical protein